MLDTNGAAYRKLMINMPPRFGKTRTLVLFSAWCFGKNVEERIIATSYGDDMANDFSRYTRNTIQEQKNRPQDIVFNDIFPATKVQAGNASYQKWALEGQFFSYLGAGIWAGITGKGASLLIEDDYVKDLTEAINEDYLNKLWNQRAGTLLSRKEEGCLEILVGTCWSANDPCGKIKADKREVAEWYILTMEAMNEKTGEMLCPALLSRESYDNAQRLIPTEIFRANYHQEPVDAKGRMYTTLKTYSEIPTRDDGSPKFDRIVNYTDTADEGNDSLVSITAGECGGDAWLIDVYMTTEGMEITEQETASRLCEYGVNWARIESNNGGRGFARAVERILYDNIKAEQMAGVPDNERRWNRIAVSWFFQNQNKRARIYSNSNYVMQHVYFPKDWGDRWPEFYKAIMTYQREGKAAHDDAPDALTGIAEIISKSRPSIRLIG